MNEIALYVDSKQYYGFKKLAVSRGIENGSWQFEMTVASDLDADAYFEIEAGQACQIKLDSETLLTGHIDGKPVNYTAASYEETATGRSTIGDLIDCSLPGKQYPAGKTLHDILVAECAPYGIAVTVDNSAAAAASQRFANVVTRDAGQTSWDFAESLARIRAVLLISNAAGGLTITRAGAYRADVDLILGKNIKACQAEHSCRSLFSEYQVSGQSAFITGDAAANSQNTGIYKTDDIARYRPCFIQTDEPVDNAACAVRAEWQRRINWGRSKSITYTVEGWRQTPGGRVWEPNEIIFVTDKRNRLNKTGLLITESRLMLTQESGRETQLTVMPWQAFDMQPLAEAAGGGFVL